MEVPPAKASEISSIGYIVRAHGLHGEWRIRLLSGEKPPSVSTIWFRKKGERGEWFSHRVESVRPYGARDQFMSRGWSEWLLKSAGVDRLEEALPWVGADIGIPRGALDPLAEGEYYSEALIGCAVSLVRDRKSEPFPGLGKVVEVLETASNDVLRVRDESGSDHLIPFTDEVIRHIDVERRIIEVTPLPGLLDPKSCDLI